MKNSIRVFALLVVAALALAVPVTAAPVAANEEGDLLWAIDNPRAGDLVTGIVWVKGWALFETEISNIDLYVNDEFVRACDLDDPRPDVNELYPQYQGIIENPGFKVGFNTDDFASGEVVSISLHVRATNGETWETSPVTVVVDHSLNQHPFGSLDAPHENEGLTGAFPVYGWALDGDGFVTQIDVEIDGQVKYGAVPGDYRPDVANAFGIVPGAAGSGFIVWVDSNDMTPGTHWISVRLTDNEGAARTLGPRKIQTFNNATNQPPFGRIDVPMYNATWACSQCVEGFTCPVSPCTTFEVLDDIYFVSGWALDTDNAGSPQSDKEGAVAYVEMLFDGAYIWNTRTDCGTLLSEFPVVPEPLDDKYVNCYSYFRPDVNMMFPGFAHSKDAGFFFVVDVCAMFIFNGYRPGLHYITVRAGDVHEAEANIDVVPIVLTCPSTDFDYPSIGYIDTPVNYDFVNGTVQYMGWVLDRDGVADVTIWVDGRVMGTAQYGIERPDVVEQHPNYAPSLSLYSGFNFFLDTTLISDGEHDTYVTVHDDYGKFTIIGQHRIVVDNNVN